MHGELFQCSNMCEHAQAFLDKMWKRAYLPPKKVSSR